MNAYISFFTASKIITDISPTINLGFMRQLSIFQNSFKPVKQKCA